MWLSLVEHLVWDQEVPGSNPGTPTTLRTYPPSLTGKGTGIRSNPRR